MNGVATKQQAAAAAAGALQCHDKGGGFGKIAGAGAVKVALESRHPADGGIVFGRTASESYP